MRKRIARAIVSFLVNTKRLQKLNLNRTGMDDMTCIEIVKLLKKIIKQMKMKMNKAVLSRDGESKHDDVNLDYLELYMNNITKTNSLKVQRASGDFISLSRRTDRPLDDI